MRMLLLALFALNASADLMLNNVDIPKTISFTDALKIALTSSEVLQRGDAQVQLARGEAWLSTSKLLPQVSAKATQDLSNAKADADSVGISVKIPLLDTKNLIASRAQRENVKAATEQFRHEHNQLFYDVGALYLDALIAQALTENALLEQQRYEKQMQSQQRKSRVGNARMLDLRRGEYLSAKANSDYLLKRHDLQQKMGALGKKIGVHDTFLLSEVTISSTHLNKSTDELVAMAQMAPDVLAASKELSTTNYLLNSERFDFLPKLSASFDGGWQTSLFNRPSFAPRDFSTRAMFTIELPIFHGGNTFASMKMASARRTLAEINLRSRHLDKKLGINNAITEMRDLEIVRANAQVAVDAAAQASASAQRMYDHGEASGLELTDAESNHASAKNLLVTSRLNLERAKLKLLLAIGKISEIL